MTYLHNVRHNLVDKCFDFGATSTSVNCMGVINASRKWQHIVPLTEWKGGGAELAEKELSANANVRSIYCY